MRRIAFSIMMLNTGLIYAQQLAFPTAEGYGKFSKGGRGGVVCEVTNLNDNGVKGPRACIQSVGN